MAQMTSLTVAYSPQEKTVSFRYPDKVHTLSMSELAQIHYLLTSGVVSEMLEKEILEKQVSIPVYANTPVALTRMCDAMPKRKIPMNTVPDSVKLQLWLQWHKRSTQGTCYICGTGLIVDQEWLVAFVTPPSRGGSQNLDNMRIGCRQCVLQMGSRNLYSFMKKVRKTAEQNVAALKGDRHKSHSKAKEVFLGNVQKDLGNAQQDQAFSRQDLRFSQKGSLTETKDMSPLQYSAQNLWFTQKGDVWFPAKVSSAESKDSLRHSVQNDSQHSVQNASQHFEQNLWFTEKGDVWVPGKVSSAETKDSVQNASQHFEQNVSSAEASKVLPTEENKVSPTTTTTVAAMVNNPCFDCDVIATLHGVGFHSKLDQPLMFPDGNMINLDVENIKFWSAQGKLTFSRPNDIALNLLAVLDRNKVLMRDFDKRLCVWNPDTGKQTVVDEADTIKADLLFGGSMISQTASYQLKLWNSTLTTTTFKMTTLFEGHTDTINCYVFGVRGHLFTGSSDTTIRVWNINSFCGSRDAGKTIHIFNGHNKPVVHIYVLSEDRIISSDKDCTRVWNIKTWQWEFTLIGTLGDTLTRLGEDRLVTIADVGLIISHIHTGNTLYIFNVGPDVSFLYKLPDDTFLVSRYNSTDVEVWDLEARRRCALYRDDLEIEHISYLRDYKFCISTREATKILA
jgi:WD40 repeat protein